MLRHIKTQNADKNRLHERLSNIPGPSYGDEMYQLIEKERHHGMVLAHEKYGELFQLPTIRGPMLFLRGADELGRVLSGKNFGKGGGTWGAIDGFVDVSNLIQPFIPDTIFDWEETD